MKRRVHGDLADRPENDPREPLARPLLCLDPMAHDDLELICERALGIASEAGALLMRGFRADAEARDKGVGGDLVTQYDERCEALLRDRLGEITPDAAFVGEESGGAESGDPGLCWYVDPIDGTTNYAHGHPWFCLSLGLWAGQEPLVGVIHAPAMGLTYSASKGAGTSRNGDRVRVSDTKDLSRSLLATGFPHDRATSPANNYGEFVALDANTHGVRRCAAAALELCVVADGGYDGFWDRGLSAWDLAAATVLIEEAGGRVSDLKGVRLRPDARRSGLDVLATNSLLHESLAHALAHARALPAPHEVT